MKLRVSEKGPRVAGGPLDWLVDDGQIRLAKFYRFCYVVRQFFNSFKR
jgi:hypothetical protein